MSGVLRAIFPGLPTGTWRDGLRPASFRGVAFEVDTHEHEGGRRVAEHEFPLRDNGETEDLGRSLRRFGFDAFVLGDDYMAARDDLLSACENESTPGTLIHPTLGEFQVRCTRYSVRETKDNGGVAVFALTFVEAGSDQTLRPRADTLSGLLSTVRRVLKAARFAFAIYRVARGNLGGFLLRAGLGVLSDASGILGARFLGMPGLDVVGIARAIGDMAGADAASTPDIYATRLTAPIEAAADAPLADEDIPEDGEALSSRTDADRDPRAAAGQVLLALAATPSILPRADDESAEAATIREASNDLIRQAALAAAAQAFALADWPHADAAIPVRDAMLLALDDAAETAANAGDDQMFRAWRALSVACVDDFRERIQQAPRLVPYAVGRSLPALTLAHRLYQDASRADELAAVTGAVHPAFLPAQGTRLSP